MIKENICQREKKELGEGKQFYRETFGENEKI